ncbi:SseB family protein [Marisediminicola senii]|uniref:SseB family protein n=1 Tax=Marisediminicola senii TaxID=2711233 RepID=UPI0013EBBC85|nr:SseB family protein [Marisediminicola senii]
MSAHHSHPGADSAGTPWAGRAFEQNAFSGDDGSASTELIAAIARFHTGDGGEREVVDALRGARLLIPLVASLGESAMGEHGIQVDKKAELAIVTVSGPDGRAVMPVFSDVAAMARWNPKARPVPADGIRVALAAANEGTDLVVLDPLSPTEFAVRRPALWAIAQSQPWVPSYRNPRVNAAFAASIDAIDDIADVSLAAGDPRAKLTAPELVVELRLRPGLDREALTGLLGRVQALWSTNETIATQVDSMTVRLS